MAGSMTFTVDSREWKDAVRQYAIDTGKDNAVALNRQMNNFAVQCMRFVRVAEQASIRAVSSLDWWPKYVAKIMSKRGHYTRAQARVYSRKLIRSRLVAVRFIRFFFVKLSQQIRVGALGKTISSGKTFAGFDASFVPATPERPIIDAVIAYTYRRRGDRTARSAERIMQQCIDAATPAVIRDMQEYGQRKADERARRYSGGMR